MTLKSFRNFDHEQNCDKHTVRQAVRYIPDSTAPRRADMIAAMLRLYAVYADGECAEKVAVDADITTPDCLVLHFSSEAKRLVFREYVQTYTRKRIRDQLRFLP